MNHSEGMNLSQGEMLSRLLKSLNIRADGWGETGGLIVFLYVVSAWYLLRVHGATVIGDIVLLPKGHKF